MTDELLVDRRGPVTRLTLNRLQSSMRLMLPSPISLSPRSQLQPATAPGCSSWRGPGGDSPAASISAASIRRATATWRFVRLELLLVV
jgi:hypothetical protein